MLSTFITFPGMPRKSLPPNEKRAPVGARVLPSLIAAVQELADADQRTFSFMVEKALRELVERHGKANAGGKSKGKP
jgi:hypothetical protein